jgi:DNA polymerase III delta prime subunit
MFNYGESILVSGNEGLMANNFLDNFCLIHKINKNNVYFIKTDQNTIKIEEIKIIKNKLKLRPNTNEKVVVAIYEAHKMTREAANTMLKILEEPPSYAYIILFVDKISSMLPTIISRCKKLQLPKSVKAIEKKYLQIFDQIKISESISQKLELANQIVKADLAIDRFLTNYIYYLKSLDVIDYNKINIIYQMQKVYKSGVNRRLFLENLLLNI